MCQIEFLTSYIKVQTRNFPPYNNKKSKDIEISPI